MTRDAWPETYAEMLEAEAAYCKAWLTEMAGRYRSGKSMARALGIDRSSLQPASSSSQAAL